jgi:hypothetical protein
VAIVWVATDDALQRDDWRAVAAQLERGHARVVVVSPSADGRTLRHYRPNLPTLTGPVDTGEVAVIGLTRAPRAERPDPPAPAPGFRRVAVKDAGTYRIVLFRGPRTRVGRAEAARAALEPSDSIVFGDLTR